MTPGNLISVAVLRPHQLRVAATASSPYASVSDREKGSLLCVAIGKRGDVVLAYDMLLSVDPALQVIL